MITHFPYPSIEQFRHIVKTVRDRAAYHDIPLPELSFIGTVKLHGTNSAVAKNIFSGETWIQSREQIITPEKDNAGFARYVIENKAVFNQLLNDAITVYGAELLQKNDSVVIYGEWCGIGVQKGVAISQLPKMFIVFAVQVVGTQTNYWFLQDDLKILSLFSINRQDSQCRIFFINSFKAFQVKIDFKNPAESQNYLSSLTMDVEKQCPVGKFFGIDGVGEGIVWKCIDKWTFDNQIIKTDDLIFKVKGDKHSDTKAIKLASIDIELIRTINEFAINVTTAHRLEKMLEKMVLAGHEVELKSIPVFLKITGQDIIKEESDTIVASGLKSNDVMKAINVIVKQWFLKMVNSKI